MPANASRAGSGLAAHQARPGLAAVASAHARAIATKGHAGQAGEAGFPRLDQVRLASKDP